MPKAPKSFHGSQPRRKGTPSARPHAAKRGYDAAWGRFRAAFAELVTPICGAKLGGFETEHCCGKSFPSRQMHLDHLIAFDGLDDPLRFDEKNLAWRCAACHAKKTIAKDGGGWQNG